MARANLKLLLPTYRARERFVRAALAGLAPSTDARRILHVGCGEGEVDRWLSEFAPRVDSCDINREDVYAARALNHDLEGVHYSVQDGERLAFPDARFDVAVCLEVLEHVGDRGALLRELARVLRPRGALVLTCPSRHFPLSYDPINGLWGRRLLPVGAYAYGHRWLADAAEVEELFARSGFVVVERRRLGGPLVGAAECYVPGLLQRALKRNAANGQAAGAGQGLAPGSSAPPLLALTDALLALDRWIPSGGKSIGLAWILRRADLSSGAGADPLRALP